MFNKVFQLKRKKLVFLFSLGFFLSSATPALAFNPFTALLQAYDHYILQPGAIMIEQTSLTFNKIIEKIVPVNQTASISQTELFNAFKNYVQPAPSAIPVVNQPVVVPLTPSLLLPKVEVTANVSDTALTTVSTSSLSAALRNLLKQKEFADQFRGPVGPIGPVGPQGLPGPVGPVGASPSASQVFGRV
ncbi:collagen-like protein, partial [Candidatus Nomurabacteria bacterium]|nr:collagen-like protein [Candidatus Nomurabacteria bacterium]